MSIYVITGGTTGIGKATSDILKGQGHTVFNIDINQGDSNVDLSKPEGRATAIKAVSEKFPEGIDGLICNAGVGPGAPSELVFALNFFANVAIAEGLRPLLKLKKGSCVITSSNTITQDIVRFDWSDLLTNTMDEERALEVAKNIPRQDGSYTYASSKHAIAKWARRISSSWAVDGLRVNVIAPGNTRTPMTESLTDEQMDMALLIPIPARYGTRTFLEPEQIANGIVFLISPLASGINGEILFVDGGIDALLRSERF